MNSDTDEVSSIFFVIIWFIALILPRTPEWIVAVIVSGILVEFLGLLVLDASHVGVDIIIGYIGDLIISSVLQAISSLPVSPPFDRLVSFLITAVLIAGWISSLNEVR